MGVFQSKEESYSNQEIVKYLAVTIWNEIKQDISKGGCKMWVNSVQSDRLTPRKKAIEQYINANFLINSGMTIVFYKGQGDHRSFANIEIYDNTPTVEKTIN